MSNSAQLVPPTVVGIGEVLWDIFPSGRLLGGAPANFTYVMNLLGDCGIVASRVGNDKSGNEACRVMSDLGLDVSYVQRDDAHETGTAGVVIDSAGQPTFSIKESVAWDFLEWTDKWSELSRRADVVCFGSLAQRSGMSAATIEQFVRNTRPTALRICDVNLRKPFYNKEVLCTSFSLAHIVKLNDQELRDIASLFDFSLGTDEALARRLMSDFGLRLVCVTRGARGSLLVAQEQTVAHNGLRVRVADAVGSGDAFTACLVHYYVRGKPLEEISESANRLAAWIATQEGAMPRIHKARLLELLDEVVLE